jgi:hypothetical protein
MCSSNECVSLEHISQNKSIPFKEAHTFLLFVYNELSTLQGYQRETYNKFNHYF